jgi:hypothetical protein
MLPATVGFLSLVAIVFFFGVLSAHNAAKSRKASGAYRAIPNSSPDKKTNESQKAKQDPAMAMAGATGANPDYASHRTTGS